MTDATDERLANLLGALGTGLVDAVQDSLRAVTDIDATTAGALLALLDIAPDGSVRRLSAVLGLTHSGAVRLVDRLETLGYVDRRPGADGRTLRVSLTRAGGRLARRLRQARSGALRQVAAGVGPARRAGLTALCEQLVEQLTLLRLERRAAGDAPAGGALCRFCDFAACGRPAGECPAQQAAR